MESLQYLYELMEKDCSIAVLGYRAKHERLKDEFVSRLNHYKIEEISSSFDVLSIVRDIKINSLIDGGDKFDWLVLDINDVVLEKKDDLMSRAKEIRKILKRFRNEIYKKFEEDNETEFGLDFDDPPSINDITTIQRFSVGDSTIYISDLVFHFESGKLLRSPYIKIMKNRMGGEVDIDIDDIVKTVNRDRISTLFK